MPYCAKCLIEYVDGTTQCEDCGANLLPGSPPAPPPRLDLTHEMNLKLAMVRVFSGGTAQMDAELARNILHSQGIPSLLQGETAAEMIPVLDVPLYVREEDKERANRVLQDYFDSGADRAPDEVDAEDPA